MDQKKIGSFIKELRKEKDLTQEQLAEKLNVTGRTISRWETGAYMPDISMLVELAGIFDVEISEIVDGEWKYSMNSETMEIANKLADYSNMEKNNMLGWIRKLSIAITVMSVAATVKSIFSFYWEMNEFKKVFEAFDYLWLRFCLIFGSEILMSLSMAIMGFLMTLYTYGKLRSAEKNKTLYRIIWIITIIVIILGIINLIVHPTYITMERYEPMMRFYDV